VAASDGGSQSAPATAWRTIDTWSVNGLKVTIGVSPDRHVRLLSAVGDSSATTSAELTGENLLTWTKRVSPEVNRASAAEFILPDVLLIAPYPSAADFRAYAVTFADTSGKWVATRTAPAQLAMLVSDLQDASLAATLFTEQELRATGPISRTDAIVGELPMQYPSNVCIDGSGFAQLTFQVDSTGKVVPNSTRVDVATSGDYALIAGYNVFRMHFTPATIERHKVSSWLTHTFNFKPAGATAVTVVSSGPMEQIARVPANALGATISCRVR